MKFSSTFSLALLALAKVILADSETFGLLSIRSGSNLQYASVYANDGKLYVGSGSDSAVSAVVTDAGKLKLNNDDSTFAVVGSDGTITEGSEADATDKFSIRDGHLIFDGVDGFRAIPEGSTYLLSTQQGENAVGIAIRATASNGQPVPDFTPSGDDGSNDDGSSSDAPSATSTLAPTSTDSEPTGDATSTAVAEQTSSAAAISQISDGQIQAIQTENGAPKAVIGLGAGVAAAAAALLL